MRSFGPHQNREGLEQRLPYKLGLWVKKKDRPGNCHEHKAMV